MNGYLFSGSWGALVIILGEQAHNFGDLGSLAKKKVKASILFDFL